MAKLERTIPLLAYADIPAAHDFLVRVFGLEAGGVIRDADGEAIHGEVRAGGTTIWLHRVTPEHGLGSADDGMPSSGLVIHVDDVDAHFTHTRAAAGARIDSEPIDQPYGQREYGARDLEGHRWWFATTTSER